MRIFCGITLCSLFAMTTMNCYAQTTFHSTVSAPTPPPQLTLPTGNDLFKGTIQVIDQDGKTITKQYSENTSIEDIIEKYSDMESNTDFSDVTDWDQSQVSGNLNIRGVPAYLSSTQDAAGDNAVTITVAGDTATFTDKPNDSAYKQLGDWFKGEEGNTGINIQKDLSKAFVNSTAIDPVAGNPNSLLSKLVDSDFNVSQSLILHGDTKGLDVLNMSPQYSDDSVNNPSGQGQSQIKERDLSLPILYSHYFNRNNVLTINLPLNYSIIGEAKSYNASLGVYYSHVMKRTQHLAWALTPQFQSGANFSQDMGSGTVAYSAGLGSRTLYHRNHMTFGLSNVIEFLKTIPVKIGDIETPYDIENIASQSGIDLAYSINGQYKIGGNFQYFHILSGSTWYIPNYKSVGITLAKEAAYQDARYDQIALKASYSFGDKNYKGFAGSLSISF